MARLTDRLTVLKVQRANTPGLYPDGRNLYLQVGPTITKSWLFRYALRGKTRDMGLGPFPLIGLAEARQKATDARRLLLDKIDPIEHRNAQRAAVVVAEAKTKTFDECAAGFVVDREKGWTAKHKHKWEVSIALHVSPTFGKLPVSSSTRPRS